MYCAGDLRFSQIRLATARCLAPSHWSGQTLSPFPRLDNPGDRVELIRCREKNRRDVATLVAFESQFQNLWYLSATYAQNNEPLVIIWVDFPFATHCPQNSEPFVRMY